jgi:TDG/mug DNA glycosylase family protein
VGPPGARVGRHPGAVVHAAGGALPLRRAALSGASLTLRGIAGADGRLPLALGEVHRALPVGAGLELALEMPADDADRAAAGVWVDDVLTGAGFGVRALEHRRGAIVATATRERTLADTVAAGMRLLVCGLNPSVLSADVGVGFARPGNRFWPAAIAAGIASRPRDPRHALHHHGTGMTDVVKRATVAAAELTAAEYRDGVARVERLCRWARPRAICFVGLAGWRAAVDRRAVAGVQPRPFGGVAVYVMPSTSGLNAHSRPADLADHLRAALALTDRG